MDNKNEVILNNDELLNQVKDIIKNHNYKIAVKLTKHEPLTLTDEEKGVLDSSQLFFDFFVNMTNEEINNDKNIVYEDDREPLKPLFSITTRGFVVFKYSMNNVSIFEPHTLSLISELSNLILTNHKKYSNKG